MGKFRSALLLLSLITTAGLVLQSCESRFLENDHGGLAFKELEDVIFSNDETSSLPSQKFEEQENLSSIPFESGCEPFDASPICRRRGLSEQDDDYTLPAANVRDEAALSPT
ncbi:hypothetical protein SELMODRAFT_417552 [Selaginella moellendorffii]|uniref:Uncharacterized protein n=1 Tax=Selaginella moellendorffii TaxID=88036 RepID=D8S2U4_SELML|nr:uncharacterized protein LOC9656416 [Selaginella moellendorffii]EFJ20991.1 hypothetical protein SELMODRAFT_417552 [Selaginella moellendorffii]|eukprot:XP_002977653.1 uncharacterized protein LOC9656416 [Selaginella moellendorffii]